MTLGLSVTDLAFAHCTSLICTLVSAGGEAARHPCAYQPTYSTYSSPMLHQLRSILTVTQAIYILGDSAHLSTASCVTLGLPFLIQPHLVFPKPFSGF